MTSMDIQITSVTYLHESAILIGLINDSSGMESGTIYL